MKKVSKFDEYYRNALQARILLHKKCANSKVFKEQVRHACAGDFSFFCNNFLYTYNPRIQPADTPFILYPRQKEFIRWVEYLLNKKKDGFVDKPRDVGATATIMAFLYWNWLFTPGFAARVGSRKEDLVDKKGDPDTLFAKIDYYLSWTPKWLLPKGFNKRTHRNHLLLNNPDNGNTLSGESANKDFSRGGRRTLLLYDEIGFWDYSKSAWNSGGDVTNVRLAMTTPPPSAKNSFAYRLKSGQEGQIEIFEFEYYHVPHKDKAWFAVQEQRRSREELEREVLKSYTGAMVNRVYKDQFEKYVVCQPNINYDPNLPLFVSWDFGVDATAIIWWQKDIKSQKIYMIDSYKNKNTSIYYYLPFVGFQIESDHKYEYSQLEMRMIVEHASWRTPTIQVGDPDSKKRSLISVDKHGQLLSVKKIFQDRGVYLQSQKHPGHLEMRNLTMELFKRLAINSQTCEDVIDDLLSCRYPNVSENSQRTKAVSDPIHDATSHFRTAVEYFAHNEPKYSAVKHPRFVRRIGGYNNNITYVNKYETKYI